MCLAAMLEDGGPKVGCKEGCHEFGKGAGIYCCDEDAKTPFNYATRCRILLPIDRDVCHKNHQLCHKSLALALQFHPPPNQLCPRGGGEAKHNM